MSLEARANAAGLNLCFSAHFVHHFRIKSGSRTFLDIPGQCLGVTGRYANTLSVETLFCLLASVASLKIWNAVLVNDKHSQLSKSVHFHECKHAVLSDGLPNVVESKRSVRVDNDEHSQPES